MWRLGLSTAILASACQYDRPRDVVAIDATPIDAPPPCTPSTTVCDDAAGVYTECDVSGSVVRQLTCPLGCATDTEQCLDINPHNGLAMYLDMVEQPPDLLATGPILIDPASGGISEAGVPRTVPSFTSPTGLRVFVVHDLRWASTVDVVRSAGAPGIAFLATGTIVIEGVVDVSANGEVAGPGGAGPASTDSDCTLFDFFSPMARGVPGLGGGGGYAIGGAGGAAFTGAGGPAGPVHPIGTAPFGGCAGGTYFEGSAATVIGGAGGGGLQLASRKSIALTASAAIDASGGGGHATLANRPGAGGGAGGTILLEAPSITIDGARVVLSVKGGGGGGAGNATLRGGNGGDGGTDAMPAAGGWTPATGTGGAGGLTGGGEGGLTGLADDHHGGGGGGSAGHIATFSGSGTTAPTNGAALLGPHVDGRLATRHVP